MPPLEVRGIEAVWTHIMTRRPRKEGGQSPRSRQSNMDMSQNREGPKKYPVPLVSLGTTSKTGSLKKDTRTHPMRRVGAMPWSRAASP